MKTNIQKIKMITLDGITNIEEYLGIKLSGPKKRGKGKLDAKQRVFPWWKEKEFGSVERKT